MSVNSPNATVTIEFEACSPLASDALTLIREHMLHMHATSPKGSVNAFDVAALDVPEITFFVARINGQPCGCGALLQVNAATGELKAMRTREAYRRKGVAQAVLDAIVCAARSIEIDELCLETGTGDAFDAAHAFYRRNGFEYSAPFGSYQATAFNRFMRRGL